MCVGGDFRINQIVSHYYLFIALVQIVDSVSYEQSQSKLLGIIDLFSRGGTYSTIGEIGCGMHVQFPFGVLFACFSLKDIRVIIINYLSTCISLIRLVSLFHNSYI